MEKKNTRFARALLGATSVLLLVLTAACAQWAALVPTSDVLNQQSYNMLQFNVDPQHSGNNTRETLISDANIVATRKIFSVYIPGQAEESPVFLSKVLTPKGEKNLLFMTNTQGTLLAMDADTGDSIWQKQFGANGCKINNSTQDCYTSSAPAIDPNLQYIYTAGLDGKVHKLKVSDGTEVTTGGWPEMVTLKPDTEKISSALSIAVAKDGNSYLYVATAGYPGDKGDYQGHLTAINLSNGSQHTFNVMCSNQDVHFTAKSGATDCPATGGGIWSRPGVIYDSATNRIYVATGNGPFDPAKNEWGNSVLALNPDGTGKNGKPLDSYTPTNWQQLSNQDADLGSTAPTILPVPSNSKVKNLALQVGKDGLLRLINLDNMSGKGGPGNTGGEVGSPVPVPQGGAVLAQPAMYVNQPDQSTWTFVANDSGLSAFKLLVNQDGIPYLKKQWQSADAATSPFIAQGILYDASTGIVRAIQPLTGVVRWTDNGIGRIHWASPALVSGVLYIADRDGHLITYSLDGTLP